MSISWDGCEYQNITWIDINGLLVFMPMPFMCLCEGADNSCSRCLRTGKSFILCYTTHATCQSTSSCIRFKCDVSCFPMNNSDSDDDNRVYIKKPPNAFMLFMEQQRANVSKEIWRKGSGAVNSHLAEIVRGYFGRLFFLKIVLIEFIVFSLQWRSMSKEEQSSYFSESERLNILHKLMYPNWSHQMNYVSIQHASYASLHWW